MPTRIAVGLAGLLVGGYCLWVAAHAVGYSFAAESVGTLVLFGGVGVALLAAGLISSAPASPLLVLTSAAWLVAPWATAPTVGPLTLTAGLVLAYSTPALVTHLLVGTRQPWGRWLVGTGYVVTVGLLGVLPTLFFDPLDEGCLDCPKNLLLAHASPGLVDRAARMGMALALVWAAAATGGIARNSLVGSSLRRRHTGLQGLGGTTYLATWIWLFAASLATGHLGHTQTERTLWVVQAVGLLILALGSVLQVIRARRTRTALAGLVLDLETGARVGGLRAALAERVGDPTLRVGYLREEGGYIDADGHSLVLPRDPARTTPLAHDGHELAVVVHQPGFLDDPVLTQELTEAGHLGLVSEGLRARSLALLADLQASRIRLLEASDEQARRIERDLHDGAQQRLVGLSFTLGLLASRGGPDSGRLTEAGVALQDALDQLRTLGRGIFPVVLLEQGLTAALLSLSESAPLRLVAAPARRLPRLVETTAYLIVARAADAGPVDATIAEATDRLVVHVDATAPPALGDVPDRVRALGGTITSELTPDRLLISAEIPTAGSP